MSLLGMGRFATRRANDVAAARRISARLKLFPAWEPLRKMQEVMCPWREGGEVLVESWQNRLYDVTCRRWPDGWRLGGGPHAQLGVSCVDGEPRHDWRAFQCIKNDIVGPEWEAVELFPAESRLSDPSNYYLLYCAPRIPIGFFAPRVIVLPEASIAPQRGWARPPADAVGRNGGAS